MTYFADLTLESARETWRQVAGIFTCGFWLLYAFDIG
jgi:hypothetical protein